MALQLGNCKQIPKYAQLYRNRAQDLILLAAVLAIATGICFITLVLALPNLLIIEVLHAN